MHVQCRTGFAMHSSLSDWRTHSFIWSVVNVLLKKETYGGGGGGRHDGFSTMTYVGGDSFRRFVSCPSRLFLWSISSLDRIQRYRDVIPIHVMRLFPPIISATHIDSPLQTSCMRRPVSFCSIKCFLKYFFAQKAYD